MWKGLAFTAALAAAVVWAADAIKPVTPQYVFTSAPRYDPKAWIVGRDRFPSGASVILVSAGARRAVAPGFHSSADPAVSFDGGKLLFAGKRSAADRWQIWEAAIAGGDPRQVTSGDADRVRPLYLPDGRIVCTRMSAQGSDIEVLEGAKAQRLTFVPGWYLTDDVLRDGRILFESAAGGIRELFTVYPDGTGVESLRCDHGPDRSGARQAASGDVIFSVGKHLARFTSALAQQAGVAQPALESSGPVAEVAPGTWIVALRPKPAANFELFLWTKELAPLEAPAGANAVQPAVVAARVPPRDFPSALVAARTTGNLLCLNARASRTPMPGEVGAVRLYTRDAAGGPLLLGQTVVERDGSFYVEVPADQPLRIEALDAAGSVVRAERGWFWMRPSEQRICVGCHAGPERAPENKLPDILVRTVVPVKMLGGQ